MNLKYLLEEHQKIYSWKYSNCQNIYLNQYPYAISINNKISNFELNDIKESVLEMLGNRGLEVAKAFDILSSTLYKYQRELCHLAIEYYLKIGVNKELLHHNYLMRVTNLLFKNYKSDRELNTVREEFVGNIINWAQDYKNHQFLTYIANLDINFSNEIKGTLKQCYLSAIQHLFSLPFTDDVIQRSFLYLDYYDYAIKLSNKDDINGIRKEKIKTLDILADLQKDLFHKIYKKELALTEQKELFKSSQSTIDEQEFVKRDKELKSLNLQRMKSMSSIDLFENNPELKESIEKLINDDLDKLRKGINESISISEAIYVFVAKYLPKYKSVVENAKISGNSFIRQIGISTQIFKNDGSAYHIKENEYEHFDISEEYLRTVEIFYLTVFIRLLSSIKDKYTTEEVESFIEFVCDNSYIVFPERKEQWFDCLMAGFNNDFNISIGVVKQIENLIRFILEDCNVSIYKPNFSGVLGLGGLLSKKELEEILDEDYLGLLKWLFQNAFGPSLRNADAHGNFDDMDYYSGIMFFIWWFALKWCVLTVPWERE